MFYLDVLSSILPSSTETKEIVDKSFREVDVVVQNENDTKKVKMLKINEIKEKRVLEFLEKNTLSSDWCLSFIVPSKVCQLSNANEYMLLEREYYSRDVEQLIEMNSLSKSDMCDVMCLLCNMLMILNEYGIVVHNLKSSNVIYETDDDNIKLCDLWLNTLRKEDDLRIYDICFTSPEELEGLEYNDGSVIWSIGCILYEMTNKKLPFSEDDNILKTLRNIFKCKYSFDVECDDSIKELIERVLKVRNEDRMSLKELREEMMKMNELLKDCDNNLMICKERNEIILANDYVVIVLPILYPYDYYLESNKWKIIRDVLIKSYNKKPNEKILSMLLMMKLYKERNNEGDDCIYYRFSEKYSIKDYMEFQILHKCTEDKQCILAKMIYYNNCKKNKICYLDEMVFNIDEYGDNNGIIRIDPDCFCLCEEGLNYLFKILKLINPSRLKFVYIPIPNKLQLLFASYFTQLTSLRELSLSCCCLTSDFFKSFIKSIPFMKLKYLNVQSNPVGPECFKLLLPYVHLLINNDNELDLCGMSLNDESMMFLSEELYKYPNLNRIDITQNYDIRSVGLKALFSKFPISSIEFDYNKRIKELLVDKDIPELIKYIKFRHNNKLKLCGLEIDDYTVKKVLSIRSNELKNINELDLSNNKLSFESVETLINNLSSFTNLKELHLNGNLLGDLGMKLFSPHLNLLEYADDWYFFNTIDCRKMGLSSVGLRYLVDGLKNVHENIKLDISDNSIDGNGIEYLMNYMKVNNNIKKLLINENPIGNSGFILLLKNIDVLMDENKQEMNLSNISIDDESVKLLASKIASIKYCEKINLNRNNIGMKGLKSICKKSLEQDNYPFIEMSCSSWTKEESKYYSEYCDKKNDREYIYSDDFLFPYYT